MEGLSEFKQLQPSNVITDLIQLIDEYLPGFTSSSEFVKILEKKKNENQHSLSFCVYMTNRCNSRFYFGRENAQFGSSVIDIGVYYGENLIFTIEAKLLPTPTGTKKSPRDEHEYVYGAGAGIQRFKDERHGLDNIGNLLPESGMIAFVKQKDYNYWLKKVNQWILDASWTDAEKLQGNISDAIAKLCSSHIRKGKTHVLLHHYWITVTVA
ncbi:hypothetical protein BH10BAC2_BH10BAC2_26940 [soil metagenome]